MPSPGGAVILSLRTARSVYAGGGVEEEGRRLKRSSCELEEEDGEEKEEEGAYAGGSVIVVVTVPIFPVFYLCVGQRVLGRAGSRGVVIRGMKHDEVHIYASVKKNEVQQYRVVRYTVQYVVGDRGLGIEEQVEKRTRSRPIAVAPLWPKVVNLVL
jgi:hypothetical protein